MWLSVRGSSDNLKKAMSILGRGIRRGGYAMIEKLSVQFPIKECCVALSVSRSGYYRWAAKECCLTEQANAELLKEIQRVYDEHQGRYGSPRITRALRQEGERCEENRVARLMRDNKLAARRKRAFRPRTTLGGQRAAPNLISASGSSLRAASASTRSNSRRRSAWRSAEYRSKSPFVISTAVKKTVPRYASTVSRSIAAPGTLVLRRSQALPSRSVRCASRIASRRRSETGILFVDPA